MCFISFVSCGKALNGFGCFSLVFPSSTITAKYQKQNGKKDPNKQSNQPTPPFSPRKTCLFQERRRGFFLFSEGLDLVVRVARKSLKLKVDIRFAKAELLSAASSFSSSFEGRKWWFILYRWCKTRVFVFGSKRKSSGVLRVAFCFLVSSSCNSGCFSRLDFCSDTSSHKIHGGLRLPTRMWKACNGSFLRWTSSRSLQSSEVTWSKNREKGAFSI